MNRVFLLSSRRATALFVMACISADTTRAAEHDRAPEIIFKSTTFDFGRLTSGQSAKHNFTFTNTGSGVLEISEVKPGCGCTTAGEWDRTVNPGKTGVIPLQFNSAGFGGAVTKSATVVCNDPRQSNVILSLKGVVWKPIDVSPTVVVFQPTEEDQARETKVVRIVSDLDQPLKLFDLECTEPSLTAEVKTVKAGKEFELNVTSIPPFRTRYASASITLKTSSREVPLLVVPVSIVVQPTMSIIPEQIQITSAPLSGGLTSFVTIVNNSKKVVSFSEPRSSESRISVRFHDPNAPAVASPGNAPGLKALEHGQQLTVAVTFPEGFQIHPGQKVVATIKTTHPKVPFITVPILNMSFPTTEKAQ
jgi:hypothetical protein